MDWTNEYRCRPTIDLMRAVAEETYDKEGRLPCVLLYVFNEWGLLWEDESEIVKRKKNEGTSYRIKAKQKSCKDGLAKFERKGIHKTLSETSKEFSA